jgi:hypothetical protein
MGTVPTQDSETVRCHSTQRNDARVTAQAGSKSGESPYAKRR